MILRPAGVFWVLCLVPGILGCGLAESGSPVATPAVELKRLRVPLGGPLEMNVRFAVSEDAPRFSEDYRIFLHFLDAITTDDFVPLHITFYWLEVDS